MDYDKLIKKAISDQDISGVLHLGACSPCNQLKIYEESNLSPIVLVEGNPDLIEDFSTFHPQLKEGCVLIEAVISDKDKEPVEFHIIYSKDKSNRGVSSILNRKKDKNFLKERSVKTLTKTVDTLLTENNIDFSSIDLLVMDIQGAELNALRGSLNLLPHLKAICTEVSWQETYVGQPDVEQIDDFLNSHGFHRSETMKVPSGKWGEALYLRSGVQE